MATGSTDTGRWIAHRTLPPVSAAEALALAPADALAAGALALGAVEAGGVLHAAITALTDASDRPTTDARWMNWRLVIWPVAYFSTRSRWTGAHRSTHGIKPGIVHGAYPPRPCDGPVMACTTILPDGPCRELLRKGPR